MTNTILLLIVFFAVIFGVLIYNFNGDEQVENYTGGMNYKGELYPEKCINGVVYYNQGISLAIAGKPNGMFYTCVRNK